MRGVVKKNEYGKIVIKYKENKEIKTIDPRDWKMAKAFLEKEVYFEKKKDKADGKYKAFNVTPLKGFSPVHIDVLSDEDEIKSINFSLLFNKYWWKWKYKKNRGYFELELLKGNDELKKIIEIFPNEHLEKFQKKMNNFLSLLKKQVGEENFWEREYKTEQRLIIGLGSEHIHETSIVLHHVFGVPYIPATVLKGVVRSFVIEDIWKRLNGKYDKQKIDNWIEEGKIPEEVKNEVKTTLSTAHKIFGFKKNKGVIRFLDAFPVKLNLSVDVMNPHYPEYYQNQKPQAPSDWQNPKPIFFLAIDKSSIFKIGKDSIFKFAFLIEENVDLGDEEKKKLKIQTEKWLQKTVQEFGLGAKTALGYGLFT